MLYHVIVTPQDIMTSNQLPTTTSNEETESKKAEGRTLANVGGDGGVVLCFGDSHTYGAYGESSHVTSSCDI